MNVSYKEYKQSVHKRQLKQRNIALETQTQSCRPYTSNRITIRVQKHNEDYSKVCQKKLYNQNSITPREDFCSEVANIENHSPKKNTAKFKYKVQYKGSQDEQAQKNNQCQDSKNILEKVNVSFVSNPNGKRQYKSLQVKDEAKSIIIDEHMQNLLKTNQAQKNVVPNSNQQHLLFFRQRAAHLNFHIQAGLSNIQKLIQQAKKKKKQKLIGTQQRHAVNQSRRRSRFKQQQIKQVEIFEQELMAKQRNSKINQTQLQNDFKTKGKLHPHEYKHFINALALQIQKDTQFTNKIQDLNKRNQLNEIKSLIMLQVSKYMYGQTIIDESFFEIQPSEVDPLGFGQSSNVFPLKYKLQEIQKLAIDTFKHYKDIQNHFNTKLCKKFQKQTIQLFFQELSRFNYTISSNPNCQNVTIGHLLSYLNMKTNKCFRNRAFIKMLKRITPKSNETLVFQSFIPFIKA